MSGDLLSSLPQAAIFEKLVEDLCGVLRSRYKIRVPSNLKIETDLAQDYPGFFSRTNGGKFASFKVSLSDLCSMNRDDLPENFVSDFDSLIAAGTRSSFDLLFDEFNEDLSDSAFDKEEFDRLWDTSQDDAEKYFYNSSFFSDDVMEAMNEFFDEEMESLMSSKYLFEVKALYFKDHKEGDVAISIRANDDDPYYQDGMYSPTTKERVSFWKDIFVFDVPKIDDLNQSLADEIVSSFENVKFSSSSLSR